jgi:signal transduction histidine kinase
MNKKPPWVGWIVLAGSLLLFLSGSFLNHFPTAEQVRADTEAVFQYRQAQAESWIKQDSLWQRISDQGWYDSSVASLASAPFPLFLVQNDSLLAWGGAESTLRPAQVIDTLTKIQSTPLQHFYMLQHTSGGADPWVAIAAIPIGRPVKAAQAGARPIHRQDGGIAYFSVAGHPPLRKGWAFGLQLIAVMGLLIALYLLSCVVETPFIGKNTDILLASILGCLLTYLWLSTIRHSDGPILHKLINTPIGKGRLFDYLAGAGLLLWLLNQMQYLGWRVKAKKKVLVSILAVLAYFSVGLGVLAIGRYIRSLVLQSGLAFNFQNILLMEPGSFLGLLTTLLFLLALFLYSLWIVKSLQALNLTRNRRFLCMGAGILLSSLTATVFTLGLSLPILLLILVLYITLIDLFIELKAASPAWVILWLALLSAFATGLLFKFKLEKGDHQRAAFAHALAQPQDALAEVALNQFSRSLHDSGYTSLEDIQSLVRAFPYLDKNYSWHFSGHQGDLETTQSMGWFARKPNAGYFSYAVNYPVKGQDSYRLDFKPSVNKSRRVSQELVPAGTILDAPYEFAVLWQGQPILQRGYIKSDWLEEAYWQGARSVQYVNSKRARTYLKTSPGGYDVLVTEQLGGYNKPASLFSYLLVLLTLLTLMVFGLNRYLGFLPATPNVLLLGEPSLRYRIQVATIALGLAAFLLAGVVTAAFVRKSALKNQAKQLLEQVDNVQRDLKGSVGYPYTNDELAELAEVHQLDIYSFTAQGHLQAASSSYLFDQQLEAKRINPLAIYAYQQQGVKPVIIPEKAGLLNYRSAYIPVREENGRIGHFLEIAFASGEKELKATAISFVGNLLNLYVFLLIIASAFAIVVARSITNPLLEMGQKLRRTHLGKNEPLEWDSQDEIGQLISAYNDMIVQLEESTEKLRQSEREGAWREMAKQVAHEIKNPLTPMKLSIQHLQRAQQADPERAKALIGRVAQTVIEQIDGLAHIATAFSNFAKMPQAQLEVVELNQVMASVYALFTENNSSQTTFRLQMEPFAVMVLADPKQLTRVFNNLIKNALQALPDDCQGIIEISLRTDQGEAIVRIKDNGSGIPEEVRSKVFQPNFTTKSSGMGLGLAMCKNMIEDMGGKIYFETEEEVGTSFFVRLPLHP